VRSLQDRMTKGGTVQDSTVNHKHYRKVNIPQNKTDIYRRRHSMINGKTDNELCPIYWLKRYILLVGLSRKIVL
jgi:hypothetical protein